MIQNVFVMWASWEVWRELINQIQIKDQKWDNNMNPTRIVWVSNSKRVIFDSDWVDPILLKLIWKSREFALDILLKKWQRIDDLQHDFLDLIKFGWLEWSVIFVDVTAWRKELIDLHWNILTWSQNSLVTANKNPVALSSMEEFRKLTGEYGRYNTNTTVMWWWGVLDFVDSRTRINDTIKRIEGAFSWTIWYIMSELQKWDRTFSEIVREAKKLWYTEPNIMDDLDGSDVAKKLVILARFAWHDVNMSDVDIYPLIDLKYWEYKWEDFLKAIKEENGYFQDKIWRITQQGNVLRYIWEMLYDKNTWALDLFVGPKEVSIDSDLWRLSGTSNLAIVETGILCDPYPHVIKSRGAWLEVTAWAIRVGIESMLPKWLSRK